MQLFILISFLFSGLSALVYEVVWTRALSLVLGSTVYSLSTMLATFMAGLAIGSFIGGRLADKAGSYSNLLFYYGISEVLIGLSGIVSVPVIYLLPPVYFMLFHALINQSSLFFLSQFFLASLMMIIPTMLMGLTFPLVSRALTDSMDRLGRSVGSAYSFNTIGAILGSVLAGFVFIPGLGLKTTALIAGILNLTIGITLYLYLREKVRFPLSASFLSLSFIPI